MYHTVGIMKTKKHTQILLVLVPHQDIRVKLRKYSEELLNAGLTNVYNFPLVAPLASLSKPLNPDELKHIAYSLREINSDSKLNIVETSFTTFQTGTDDMRLFGPKLDMNISFSTFDDNDKIIKIFSPLVIGTYLIPTQECSLKECSLNDCRSSSFEKLSFRAAAVTNMFWKPFIDNGKTGYKWKIGKLTWLPKQTKLLEQVQLPE